ncbi:MAG: Ig-like domain-containing protein [Ruminococcus sp.]|nr:Ig-like domain-containing protein [Candidatus Copronaster equi]
MSYIPETTNFEMKRENILNAIRNGESADYKNAIPIANDSVESLRAVGKSFVKFPNFMNNFISSLVNRVITEVINSRSFENPWKRMKKGILEYGETIEEVYTALCKPHKFDQKESEASHFKREFPDVLTAFHSVNYKTFYKQTIESAELKSAFLSWDNFDRFINNLIENMIKSAEYDEFQVMKYCIARAIVNGELHSVFVPQPTETNTNTVISAIKGASNKLLFPSNKYNFAKVTDTTPRDKQILICNAEFDALFTVNTLATAFHMTEAEFMGAKVLVDSFGDFDYDRLDELLNDDVTFRAFTAEEKEKLNNIPAVLIDEDWFMVYDNLEENTQNFNAQGLYRNHFYHVWKIFSRSPFKSAIVFSSETPTVSTVTVSPTAVTSAKNQSVQLNVTVSTSGFADKRVTWSVDTTSANKGVVVDGLGRVYLPEALATGNTVTVTATSVYNSAKKATATITIS